MRHLQLRRIFRHYSRPLMHFVIYCHTAVLSPWLACPLDGMAAPVRPVALLLLSIVVHSAAAAGCGSKSAG